MGTQNEKVVIEYYFTFICFSCFVVFIINKTFDIKIQVCTCNNRAVFIEFLRNAHCNLVTTGTSRYSWHAATFKMASHSLFLRNASNHNAYSYGYGEIRYGYTEYCYDFAIPF